MTDQMMTGNSPNNFPEIRGHEGFLADIAGSHASRRMHHAWLLSGPVGIGKAAIARLTAAWLLSETRQAGALFDGHSPTVKIDAEDAGANLVLNGAHPDYLAITPQLENNKSGQIKVDQIRKLIPFMMHKPARGGWRVAIVDSMDEVNRNGANAMLKLLEEPPPQAVIFLIASRSGQLPPTIRSRCRLVRMSALVVDECLAVLGRVWPDMDHEQLEILARLSQGAPGQAVKLAESGAADVYQLVCSLLHAPQLDAAALTGVCAKWGRGLAAGRDVRAGAVFCMDRLLRNAALQASGKHPDGLCRFETPVVAHLASRHTAEQLASFHQKFVSEAEKAEGLYLDFPRFLERHLSKIYEKTLP